ncbi:MAG: hypothetical protein SV375_00100 [Thermodesulfobacteriota bacterium]|nr:hypothetical protein [Thermodesulfobacteriota bacterium]
MMINRKYIILVAVILSLFLCSAVSAKGPYGHVWRDKTTAPGDTDDRASGYREGDTWIDTSADTSYTCVDDSIGAAIWIVGGGLSDGTAITGDIVLDSSGLETAYLITADATIKIPDPTNSLNNKKIRFHKQGATGVTVFIDAGSFQESGTTVYNNIDPDGWLECFYSGSSIYIIVYGTWTRTK